MFHNPHKRIKRARNSKSWRKAEHERLSQVMVVPGDGIRCPRCHQVTQIRKWREITDKQRRQKTLFAKWYYWLHDDDDVTSRGSGLRDRPPSSWPPESREIPSTQNKPYICKAESGGFRIHGTDGSVLLDNIETFSEARDIVDDRV